jgi:hypothetical protein
LDVPPEGECRAEGATVLLNRISYGCELYQKSKIPYDADSIRHYAVLPLHAYGI